MRRPGQASLSQARFSWASMATAVSCGAMGAVLVILLLPICPAVHTHPSEMGVEPCSTCHGRSRD